MKLALTQLNLTPTLLAQLEKLSLYTTHDVLLHLPRDYEDKQTVISIRDAHVGRSVLLAVTVQSVEFAAGKRRSMAVTVADDTGKTTLRFYHYYQALIDKLRVGNSIYVFGEVRLGIRGLELYHPEIITAEHYHSHKAAPQLTAIYPSTEKLKQAQLRKLIDQCLTHYADDLDALIPSALYRPYSPKQALCLIHHPPVGYRVEQLKQSQDPAVQTLIMEELVAHQLSLLQRKHYLQQDQAYPLRKNLALAKSLLAQLPFRPTNAQQRVFKEILHDLTQAKPMLRLVQGDVGAGKTLVAALAASVVLQQNRQVALMAPTEILAEQHYLNFQKWFAPLGIEVVFLAAKLKAKEKRLALARIATGTQQIVIGTHALFQQQVEFQRLTLVIIDEQHRFGVEQRLSLRNKGGDYSPHQLVMTATPIPRTLAMSAYGDLDTSVIDELPPNRTPVETVALPLERRQHVLERIAKNCSENKQAYWVCTLVEESESLDAQAAEAFFAEVQQHFPQLKVGLVHGKMKPEDKQAVMQQFKDNQLQLLIATTVIEVGVDVPNASLMVIENAERLGLSQLHQLRGRVGRGAAQSFCVLLYKSPLSQNGQARLDILRQSNDGFVIAERDLELRGAGDILGRKQTGELSFKIAQLERDAPLLDQARHIAQQMIEAYPQHSQALVKRWLPEAQNYILV